MLTDRTRKLVRSLALPAQFRHAARRAWFGLDIALVAVLCVCALALFQSAYRSQRSASFTMDASLVALPLKGFHAVEPFADRPGIFRWTGGSGLLRPPNPGGSAVLRMIMAGGTHRPLPAQVHAGPATFAFTVAADPRRYALVLPPMRGERLALTVELPAEQVNERTLGVVVSDLSVVGGGAAPAQVLLGLLLAICGGYALLRAAGAPWLAAACIVGALQTFLVLRTTEEWWRSGSLGTVLAFAGAASLMVVAGYRLRRAWLERPAQDAGVGDVRWLLSSYGLLAALTIASFSLVFFTFPSLRRNLLVEDGLLENLSSFFFLAGFLFVLLLTVQSRKPLAIVVYVLLALGSLFFFLEEISYGVRLFDIQLPTIDGYAVDGLHDFISIIYHASEGVNRALVAGLLAAALAAFLVPVVRYRAALARLLRQAHIRAALAFLGCFLVFLAAAMALDLDLIQGDFLQLLEELFETNAAVALIFAAFALMPILSPWNHAPAPE